MTSAIGPAEGADESTECLTIHRSPKYAPYAVEGPGLSRMPNRRSSGMPFYRRLVPQGQLLRRPASQPAGTTARSAISRDFGRPMGASRTPTGIRHDPI